MIERLDINCVHMEIRPRLEKYVRRKIGKLDRLLPRHAKKSVHARVILSETKTKTKTFVCETILELPHIKISAKEKTMNIFSSIDIVEAKLARQIRKYKTQHAKKPDRFLLRRLLGKVRRSNKRG